MYVYLLEEWSFVTLESVVCNKRINSLLATYDYESDYLLSAEYS